MRKRSIMAGALAIALCAQTVAFAACKDNDDGGEANNPPAAATEVMPEFDFETYDNADFTNYAKGDQTIDCESLPGQFSGYGIGDPYVFRFNGMYYLYASTRGDSACVLGWKSRDMLNWEQCTGEGLQTGRVSEGSFLLNAYAPEVYYFNGKFYMYTSPGGNGHYILSSDSPEGPFVMVQNNFGMSIDGSVFIDDDESFYFLNASGNGIEIHPMSALDEVPGKTTVLSNTKLGWTEGPMIIKRDGTYFLTYTGIHCLSPGYRIAYNTESDGNSLLSPTAFRQGADNPIILATDGEYKGLGHSSTVLGPDMDSYYIVYHNLHKPTYIGTWRSMNIDRLIFNGTQMSVDGSPTASVKANMPAFSVDGADGTEFETLNGKALTKSATGGVFTAEYNFTGDKVKCIAGYGDENNYVYVEVDYKSHAVTLNSVKDGKSQVIAEGELKNDFNPEVLHTVRIAYAEGKADVYFDNMCKIKDAEISVQGGKIGYEGGNIFFTAFSNVAKGYSDRTELKQSGAQIGASAYLPEGAYEGLTSYKLTGGSRLSRYEAEREKDMCYDGAYRLKLAKEGDFARYSVYFRKGGKHALYLTYGSEYGGKQIGVQVNLGEIKKVTLPEIASDDCDVVRAIITQIDVPQGANLITLHGTSRSAEFISFSFSPVSKGEMTESLTTRCENAVYPTDLVMTGSDDEKNYLKDYVISNEGHTTHSNTRMAAYFGDGNYSDCEISVEMKMTAMYGSSAGIILRSDNFANVKEENAVSAIQGYYVGVSQNSVFIHKYNYNFSQTNMQTSMHGLSNGTWFTVKAQIKGNDLTVYIDGEEVLFMTDARAMASGYFGLYSEGAQVTYRNLSIKTL